jgi:putative transposase
MEERYLNKFRNGTNRQRSFDYASSNAYFITLIVKNRQPLFGTISNGEMYLSELGRIVCEEWLSTFEIRKTMNLTRGAFIVMPDHFHAVIEIGKNEHNRQYVPNGFGIQTQNLGSVIRGFKAAVTTYARKKGIAFDWQRGYHDRIIRTPYERSAVEKYIRDNPKNWSRKLNR